LDGLFYILKSLLINKIEDEKGEKRKKLSSSNKDGKFVGSPVSDGHGVLDVPQEKITEGKGPSGPVPDKSEPNAEKKSFHR
jgi:hypothetical protein